MNLLPLPPELLALLGAGAWHFAMVFLRVGAMTSVLPAFGEQYVPVHVKLGVAVAFTFVVAPALPQIMAPDHVVLFARVAICETIIGLALGVGVRLFLMGLQTAGTIAAQSTSLSQVLGGIGAEAMPAMGAVLMVGGLALAVMMGLHVRVAEFLIYSYQAFPVGEFPGASTFSKWGVYRISQSFYMALPLPHLF